MTEIFANATKHDKFAERSLMLSPHEKLRFCMSKEGAFFVSHAIQICTGV